jgi:hypothetical protein
MEYGEVSISKGLIKLQNRSSPDQTRSNQITIPASPMALIEDTRVDSGPLEDCISRQTLVAPETAHEEQSFGVKRPVTSTERQQVFQSFKPIKKERSGDSSAQPSVLNMISNFDEACKLHDVFTNPIKQ